MSSRFLLFILEPEYLAACYRVEWLAEELARRDTPQFTAEEFIKYNFVFYISYSIIHLMKQERIGGGREHNVYASGTEGLIIKRPTLFALLMLKLGGKDANIIPIELEKAVRLVAGTQVRVPETQVWIIRKGSSYRMTQKYMRIIVFRILLNFCLNKA